MAETFTKSLAQRLVRDEELGDFKGVATQYNGGQTSSGSSLNDQSVKALGAFRDDMSVPFKRMKAEVMRNIVANCYQGHHISDDFTNTE